MQHLEDGYLHEIVDGEVPSEELVAVRDHLDACESCRARLDEARNDAETARELIELIEVPVEAVGAVGAVGPHRSGRWVRPLAWAASLVLAAGIGYMTRSQNQASLAQRMDPLSVGRVDTVFLDVPAASIPEPSQPAEADRFKETAATKTQDAPKPQAPMPAAAPPPVRQNAAGARAEEEQSSKRRSRFDTMTVRLDEVVVTGTAAQKKAELKDDNAKLNEAARERVANDARDQAAQRLDRKIAQPAAPSVAAAAENRLMAKSGPDATPTIISFPRAVELLGGRIKLIEGMVPARLEAVGPTVRVVYLIDEGNLVLAQVAATDSLHWNLSGPLSADSLAQLRRRIK